jgi:hypothetical protein
MGQEQARNVLISNLLSQIEDLATNQGVVGSNPAGRANLRFNINGLRAKVCRPFSCAVPLSRIFESNGTTYERIALGEKDSIRADSPWQRGLLRWHFIWEAGEGLSSDDEVVVILLERHDLATQTGRAKPAHRAWSVQQV